MSTKQKQPGMAGMRIFSYSVAGVLGLLMVSSSLAPIIADSSERALIDAPLRLVTSPITGIVTDLTLKPGDVIRAGQTLATVRNQSIDKSKLIELELKISDLESGIATQKQGLAAGEAVQSKLRQSIDEQKQALVAQFSDQVEISKANRTRFEAQQAIAERSHDREKKLKARGVVGGDLTDFGYSVEAASSQQAGAKSELEAALGRLKAAHDGVYFGVDAGPINSLLEELRTSLRETEAMMIDISGLEAKVADLKPIRDIEAERIARLSSQAIIATASGAIVDVGGANGANVSDGDAIANTIDCDNAFVVAIFSERKASKLVPGESVTIRGEGWDETVGGTIRKLVPRTTSVDDASFAVPFPPTERRELYVYVDMEKGDAAPGKGTCQVGKWVSVALDDGAIPSSNDMFRLTSRFVSEASTVFAKAGEDVAVEASKWAGRGQEMIGSLVSEADAKTAEGRMPRLTKNYSGPSPAHGSELRFDR